MSDSWAEDREMAWHTKFLNTIFSLKKGPTTMVAPIDPMAFDGVSATKLPTIGSAIMGPDGTYWLYPLTESDKRQWHCIKAEQNAINAIVELIADVCNHHQGLHEAEKIKNRIMERIIEYKRNHNL